ncbi:toll/interleukin-1 receptor domain-containing protein [Paenibacillus sp. OK003]|uniref:toll/interleukin-1 receptor domain-containing protein n=1 Tax=Paenibacillus sp. OK003 TaxID=1884380 RepID=UPI0008BBCFBC|nr:toll/interleukin-1 receptor domain-containing protein [Paenibacillus sp. OK003]SEK28869.1 TIR domain-containing protein [Paenibacillus sp. OK003]
MISKFDFFFSYSRSSYEGFSKHLIKDLSTYGIKLWVDIHNVPFGINVLEHLNEVLIETKESIGAILIISDSYFFKEWCQIEFQYFVNNNIPVFPILFQMTKKDIPMEYSFIKSLDRVTIHSINDDSYEYAINKILTVYIEKNKKKYNLTKIENTIFESLINSYIETQYKESNVISANNIGRYINYFYKTNKIVIPNFINVLINITEIKLQFYFNEMFTLTDLDVINLVGKTLIDCHTQNHECTLLSLK